MLLKLKVEYSGRYTGQISIRINNKDIIADVVIYKEAEQEDTWYSSISWGNIEAGTYGDHNTAWNKTKRDAVANVEEAIELGLKDNGDNDYYYATNK